MHKTVINPSNPFLRTTPRTAPRKQLLRPTQPPLLAPINSRKPPSSATSISFSSSLLSASSPPPPPLPPLALAGPTSFSILLSSVTSPDKRKTQELQRLPPSLLGNPIRAQKMREQLSALKDMITLSKPQAGTDFRIQIVPVLAVTSAGPPPPTVIPPGPPPPAPAPTNAVSTNLATHSSQSNFSPTRFSPTNSPSPTNFASPVLVSNFKPAEMLSGFRPNPFNKVEDMMKAKAEQQHLSLPELMQQTERLSLLKLRAERETERPFVRTIIVRTTSRPKQQTVATTAAATRSPPSPKPQHQSFKRQTESPQFYFSNTFHSFKNDLPHEFRQLPPSPSRSSSSFADHMTPRPFLPFLDSFSEAPPASEPYLPVVSVFVEQMRRSKGNRQKAASLLLGRQTTDTRNVIVDGFPTGLPAGTPLGVKIALASTQDRK
jgi:hypothetical protein